MIPRPAHFDPESIDHKVRELLDEVHMVFGQFSAWRLHDMTHEEAPWQETYTSTENRTLCHRTMTRYFRTQLRK